jgi:hypothetical protein
MKFRLPALPAAIAAYIPAQALREIASPSQVGQLLASVNLYQYSLAKARLLPAGPQAPVRPPVHRALPGGHQHRALRQVHRPGVRAALLAVLQQRLRTRRQARGIGDRS